MICKASDSYTYDINHSNTYVDTATASGVTVGGFVVNAAPQSLTVEVKAPAEITCACEQLWNDGQGGAPLNAVTLASSTCIATEPDVPNNSAAALDASSNSSIQYTKISAYVYRGDISAAICQDRTTLGGGNQQETIPRNLTPEALQMEYNACKALLNNRGCNIP